MKKIILLALLLTGCAEKEEYENAIFDQMKNEKDLKDYAIKPEDITKCIAQTSAKNMEGLLPIDPIRRQTYKNYADMLNLTKSADPKKTMEELRTKFGGAKELAAAHANYAESVVECMAGIVGSTEEGAKKAEKAAK